MALGRGSRALSPRGRQYYSATIDAELAVRHAEQKHRRSGGRTQGPSPFQDEDREHFREVLERLLGSPAPPRGRLSPASRRLPPPGSRSW